MEELVKKLKKKSVETLQAKLEEGITAGDCVDNAMTESEVRACYERAIAEKQGE